ncbi:MAG: hypothetical protein HY706_13680 [Candidatus Hydrogenedentes bacterium]|nr:hypothetical protein [Candidatus Hydrogenedentota bacterium]
MLSRALKMAFWVCYDHLGKLMLANLVWALALAIPGSVALASLVSGVPGVQLLIGLPLGIFTVGIVLPITTAGLAHMAKILIETRDGAVRDLFTGMRLYWRRAAGLGLLGLLTAACLLTSTWFYLAKLGGPIAWLGYILSALALWVLLFVLLMGLFLLPCLVQKRAGIVETIRVTALLVLDNPLYSLGLAIQCVALTALTMVLLPLFFFFYGSAATVTVSSAYEMLSRKYARLQYQAETGTTLSPTAHIRVVGGSGTAIVDETQDDYLNRGFRDFLFPWKG